MGSNSRKPRGAAHRKEWHGFAELDADGEPITPPTCAAGHPLVGVRGRWNGTFFVWTCPGCVAAGGKGPGVPPASLGRIADQTTGVGSYAGGQADNLTCPVSSDLSSAWSLGHRYSP